MKTTLEISGRGLLDALPDGVVVCDRDGQMVYVNSALQELSGYSGELLIGQQIEMLVPAGIRDDHAANRAGYHQGGMPARPMGSGLQIALLRRDGSLLAVDVALRPVVIDEQTLVVAAVRDATDRRRAETGRAREQERLQAAVEVAQAILRGEGMEPVLKLVARSARDIAGADMAVIALASADARELIVEVTAGPVADTLLGMHLPVESSMAGAVLSSGQAWVSEDATQEPAAHLPMVVGSRLGPTLVLPLAGSLGTLTVANLVGGRVFTDQDLRVAELFASQAAVGIEFARAQEQISRLAIHEDRERIGRELHDGVIQSLFAVGMHLQATAAVAGAAAISTRIESAIDELDIAIRDLRNYIFGLRPGLLADRHLGQAIASLAADLEESSGITTAVQVDDHLAAELAGVAGDVVQMVREALSNVARHAGATTCRLSLTRDGRSALLLIDDDGHGFDPTLPGGGQGLANLRERSAGMGGEMKVLSDAREGTEIRITIPLGPSLPAGNASRDRPQLRLASRPGAWQGCSRDSS